MLISAGGEHQANIRCNKLTILRFAVMPPGLTAATPSAKDAPRSQRCRMLLRQPRADDLSYDSLPSA